MVYIGILEQSRYINSGFTEQIILFLSGNSYNDLSPFQHSVNIVGSVPLRNGGYNITQPASNYLEIPNHPEFLFGSNYFKIQFELYASRSIYNINIVNLYGNSENSYATRLFGSSLNFIYSSSGASGSSTSQTISNNNYLNSFQTIQIERLPSPTRPTQFDAILFSYNNSSIGFREIGKNVSFFNSTQPLTIGRNQLGNNFTEDYTLRNIQISRYI